MKRWKKLLDEKHELNLIQPLIVSKKKKKNPEIININEKKAYADFNVK